MKNFLPRYFSNISSYTYHKWYCKFVILLLLGGFTLLSNFSYAQNIPDHPVSKGTDNIILVNDAKIYTAKTTENGTSLVVTSAKKQSNEKIVVKKSLKSRVKEKTVEKAKPQIAKKSQDFTPIYKEQNSDSGKYFSQTLRNQVSVNFKDFHFKITKEYELQSIDLQIASRLYDETTLAQKNLVVFLFFSRGPPHAIA